VSKFKVGDRVALRAGESTDLRFGLNPAMRAQAGGQGTISLVESGYWVGGYGVKVRDGLGKYTWHEDDLTLVVAPPAVPPLTPEPTQTLEELVAENISLNTQIDTLSARLDRKRQFHKQNAAEIQSRIAGSLISK